MIPFALAFVFGAWVLQHMPVLPGSYWAFLLIPAVLPALALAYFRCRLAFARILSWILLGALAGFFWASLMAQHRLSNELPAAWEGEDVQLIGVIAGMPQQLERGERFEFDVEQVLTPNAVIPMHISLSQYTEFARSFERDSALKTANPRSDVNAGFHVGERWQLTVRLKRPHGTANPHGFDFEAWALERNIRASGYIRKDAGNRLIAPAVFRPSYLVEMVREKIHARMTTVLAGKPYGGILQALAIGDDSGVSQEDWQIFLKTGTNHLVSISGLHITMLSGFAFALVYALWRRNETLTLRLPARKAAVIVGAVVALQYALIAGFSVPTQRTLYMLSVFAWALWSGRNIAMARVLAYALLLVVVLDPWAVLAPGFWLSFGAVAFISYAVGGRLQPPHWLRAAIHTQWAVTLGLMPLLLVLFQQVSLLSPVANAVAIPVISLVVVPLTLLGSLLPLDSALFLSHWVMAQCMLFLAWISAFPLSTWQQQAPPLWTLPVAVAGVLVMLLPRGIPMRWLGVVGLLPMLLIVPERPDTGAMKVAVLDVGQGLAVVVQTRHHNLLYDAGPRYSSQSDSGSRIVVPYLRGEGIRQLDGMVISHNDNDHSGGMQSVLSQVKTKWLASSLPEHAVPNDAHGMPWKPHLHCLAGQRWQWDEVQFEMLYPTAAGYADNDIKDNDRSCVLRISSRYGSLLLVGDIEKKAEAELLADLPHALSSDVIVAPHHGSKTSSTAAFIEAVKPAAAIFTVGYRNRFRHPNKDVVDRYAASGANLYRSDADGAILLDFSAHAAGAASGQGVKHGAISIKRWRQQSPHYWQY